MHGLPTYVQQNDLIWDNKGQCHAVTTYRFRSTLISLFALHAKTKAMNHLYIYLIHSFIQFIHWMCLVLSSCFCSHRVNNMIIYVIYKYMAGYHYVFVQMPRVLFLSFSWTRLGVFVSVSRIEWEGWIFRLTQEFIIIIIIFWVLFSYHLHFHFH